MSLAQLAKSRGLPLIRDLEGTRVRLLREATTGMMAIPAGTRMSVYKASNWSNVTLKGDPCPCCGVQALVRCDVGAFEADGPG